ALSAGDLMAGVTVALVLVPQSLAYAELAGVPAVRGLYAAAAACLAAAFFASSPYLQTGPVALTALLSLGALGHLARPGSARYIGLAALLAVVVGVVRLALGVLRLGGLAYMMSQPVVIGFSTGGALVILATQLPTALGADPDGGIFPSAFSALAHPGRWDTASVVLAVATLVVMVAGRRIHDLFPAVLLAMLAALAWSALVDYDGPTLGEVHGGLPPFTLDLPYGNLPELVIPGVVIAVVGFAEAISIARRYATIERQVWDPSQELIGQGVGNLAAGACGGFPVGGSFSRTALNHLAGARTRWSGAVTGGVVALMVPFTSVLSALPRAVLAAVVIGAVRNLVQLHPFAELWRYSRAQFSIATVTFVLTLALAPRVGQAVLVGVLLAVAVHLRREILISVPTWTEDDAVHLKPKGVLYFGSVASLERTFMASLHDHPGIRRLVVHLDGLGRVDVTGALALCSLLAEAEEAGLAACVVDIPPQAARIVARVLDGRWGA
ncbi:MAG: SulP family inorganic anion transporter, partial [Acidimicrobiia bacterium]